MIAAEAETTRERGHWAEGLAQDYLRHNGLKPLAKNHRCRWGEIDLIMRDRDMVVFVKVRYRARSDFGTGAESIDRQKRSRLVATARDYLQRNAQLSNSPCRFDVISVSPARSNADHCVEWIRDAFEA